MLPDNMPDNMPDNLNIPPPDPARRAETLKEANIAFRERFSAPPQRKSLLQRLFGIGTPTPEKPMRKLTLLGGSAIALALAVVVSSSLNRESNPFAGVGQVADSFSSTTSDAGTGSTPAPQQAPEAMRPEVMREEMAATTSALPAPPPPADIFGGGQAAETESRDAPVEATEDKDNAVMAPTQQPVASLPASEPLPRRQIEASKAESREEIAPGVMGMQVTDSIAPMPPVPQGRDSFANLPDNPMQDVALAPVSTFSADTDTASYSVVRRMLESGQLPPPEAVRTEEMVNYFDYNYPLPEDKARPFQPTVAVYPTPWNPDTRLVHIGIKAFDQPQTSRPPVNLVFLVDVSGSMDEPNKLPMVKASLSMLVDKLQPTDTVSIVTYAGNSGVALPPTRVSEKGQILSVLDSLGAGGSTAGAEGLKTAYELAQKNYNKEGVNRIILATDGDFNVGVSDPGGVAGYVAHQRSSGIFLSVLGYGMGNYQDTMMQAIAQNGNGVAAYIDGMAEARRVLSDQVDGTLFTVAKDVKFQVEFNPAEVKSYRLLGYETRVLRREDFDNDKVDAGEVGSGHEVTAIYEIVPNEVQAGLRYQRPVRDDQEEIGNLRIRYKLPEASTSQLIEQPITQTLPSLEAASPDVRFAAAVAGFSRILRHSVDMGRFSYSDVIHLAESAGTTDEIRREFVDLVRTAQSLSGGNGPHPLPAEEGGVAFPPTR